MDPTPQSDAAFTASFESRSASLRRLARSLLGDPAAADDVVQETWTAYWKRPPPPSGSVDGFLATLTRRLAWRTRRGDERRQSRERAFARPERDPGPDEIVERAAALREVLELVGALREPYRRAIWQRYFDDLAPREIARASGESLATVKSRLQRGLELLRGELDRRHAGRRSDWMQALSPLGALPAGAIGLGISGGLWMGTSFKLGAAAAALVCAVGLFFWSTQSAQAPASGEFVADAANARTPDDPPGAAPVASADGARSAVGDPSQPAADPPLVVEPELLHPHLYVLAVRTIDENGLCVRGAHLKLAPVRSSLNAASVLGEGEGWTTIAWRGKEAEMDVDLQISGSDSLSGSRRIHVRAGTSNEVAVLDGSGMSQVFQVELREEPEVGVSREVQGLLLSRLNRLRGLALDVSKANDLRMVRFPHPHARFGDRFVQARPYVLAEAELVEHPEYPWERIRSLSLQVSGTIVQGNSTTQTPDTSRVSVQVFDDRGEVVANCLVALRQEPDGTEQRTLTDGRGEAFFNAVESGWWEARAGGGPGGLAGERLLVAAPQPLSWTARLDRGSHVIGHVFGADKQLMMGYLVRYESIPVALPRGTSVRVSMETAGGEEISECTEVPLPSRTAWRAPWVDITTVNEDGSFELANLPAGLGRLLVLAPGDTDGPELHVEEGVLPGGHDHSIELGASTGTLKAEVLLPEPWQSESVELRAISESTGRGFTFAQNESRFRCAKLAAGWYQVELGAGVLGWHELGRHYVARDEVDIGCFAPPLPATLSVLAPEQKAEGGHELGLTFYLRRADLDLRGEPRELGPKRILHLPAGEYWVFWKSSDGRIQHRALSLESGASVELDLRESR